MATAIYLRTARWVRGRPGTPNETRLQQTSLSSQLLRLCWHGQTETGTPEYSGREPSLGTREDNPGIVDRAERSRIATHSGCGGGFIRPPRSQAESEAMCPDIPIAQPRPEAVNVPTARVMLGGISHSSIYALIKQGTLRTVKIGRRRLVPVASIRELLNQTPA
jgi:excisionase family DNA binding protein